MKIQTASFHLEPWRRHLIYTLAAIAIAIPSIVIIGWLSGNKALILLHEDFYPMAFNKAAMLIFLGFSILLQTLHHKTSALLTLLIPLFLSALFGFESIAGVDNILYITKIESGSLVMVKQSCDLESNKGMIEVAVSDTGLGFPKTNFMSFLQSLPALTNSSQLKRVVPA